MLIFNNNMQISTINNSNSFTSRNNPIPTETFISALGKITMSEATSDDITPVAKLIRQREMLSFKLKNFYGENAAEAKTYYKQINKNSWLKDIKQYLVKLLQKPDGNSSILVAKNEDGKVIGYATMESMDNVKEKVGIIENIHLDYKYSKGDLGHYLLHKIVKTAYGQFSDIITKSPSIGNYYTYQELGFNHIPPNSNAAKILNARNLEDQDYQGWMRKTINYYL